MDKMETNFKLVIDNDIEITANTISWVSWNGHGLDQAHDGPGAGRSLFLDFKTMPLDMLLSIKNMNYEGLSKLTTKSTYKHMTEPIRTLIEVSREFIKFKTDNHIYELYIKTNPVWLKPRSPFSLQ